MLCISDSLVCDGIRHCPMGNGYESDEDTEMCLIRYKQMKQLQKQSHVRQRHHIPMDNPEYTKLIVLRIPQAAPTEMGLWQQIQKELKKIVSSSSSSSSSTAPTTETFSTDVPTRTTTTSSTSTSTTQSKQLDSAVHRTKEARDRTTLTRGLARYGPWGYLMLGMLLCGGALLMCGMWGK